MKRVLGFLSLLAALIFVATLHGQTIAQPNTDKISNQELLTLISTAHTPADHQRLANYYKAQSSFYLEQAKLHDEMGEAYKKNPGASTKYSTASSHHCDFISQSFREDATKMKELADMHEQMAKSGGKM